MSVARVAKGFGKMAPGTMGGQSRTATRAARRRPAEASRSAVVTEECPEMVCTLGAGGWSGAAGNIALSPDGAEIWASPASTSFPASDVIARWSFPSGAYIGTYGTAGRSPSFDDAGGLYYYDRVSEAGVRQKLIGPSGTIRSVNTASTTMNMFPRWWDGYLYWFEFNGATRTVHRRLADGTGATGTFFGSGSNLAPHRPMFTPDGACWQAQGSPFDNSWVGVWRRQTDPIDTPLQETLDYVGVIIWPDAGGSPLIPRATSINVQIPLDTGFDTVVNRSVDFDGSDLIETAWPCTDLPTFVDVTWLPDHSDVLALEYNSRRIWRIPTP